jgi:hypothetical protein
MLPVNVAPDKVANNEFTLVPPIVIASASTVPSKKASLNSKELVPKSTSLSVTGAKAPSTNLI